MKSSPSVLLSTDGTRCVGGRCNAGLLRGKARRGNALVELALLFPLLTTLMLGITQLAFYSYLFISTENAVRAAANRNSFGSENAADEDVACAIVAEELGSLIEGAGPLSCTNGALSVKSQVCPDSVDCLGEEGTASGLPAVVVSAQFTAAKWATLGYPVVVKRAVQMKLQRP